MLKCTKFSSCWGSVPDGGAYTALPRHPIAAFKGTYFQGKGGLFAADLTRGAATQTFAKTLAATAPDY